MLLTVHWLYNSGGLDIQLEKNISSCLCKRPLYLTGLRERSSIAFPLLLLVQSTDCMSPAWLLPCNKCGIAQEERKHFKTGRDLTVALEEPSQEGERRGQWMALSHFFERLCISAPCLPWAPRHRGAVRWEVCKKHGAKTCNRPVQWASWFPESGKPPSRMTNEARKGAWWVLGGGTFLLYCTFISMMFNLASPFVHLFCVPLTTCQYLPGIDESRIEIMTIIPI